MKCKDVQENLVGILLEMLPEHTVREMRAHMETCEACREEYRNFSAVQNAVDGLPEITPTESLGPRIIRQYDAEREKSYSYRLRAIADKPSFGSYFITWILLKLRRPAVAAVITGLIAGVTLLIILKNPGEYGNDIEYTEKLPHDSNVIEFIRGKQSVPRKQGAYNLDPILQDMAEAGMTDVPEQPWRKWEVIEKFGQISEINLDKTDEELVRIPYTHGAGNIEKAGDRTLAAGLERLCFTQGLSSWGDVYASYNAISVKTIIMDGLQWLTSVQNSSGSWGVQPAEILTTSLAGMCLLADRDMIETFGYGRHAEKACSFILGQARRTGYCGGGDANPVRSHIAALTFLVEYADYTGREDLEDIIGRGFTYLYSSGNLRGWEAEASFSPDSSVVGWYITLLMSAEKTGIKIPKAFADRARAWVTRAAHVSSRLRDEIGKLDEADIYRDAVVFTGRHLFRMKLNRPDMPRIAERLIGFVGREIEKGAAEINPHVLYFASIGLFSDRGKEWYMFNLAIKSYLADTAERISFNDGTQGLYWPSYGKQYSRFGDVYYTAMYILALQSPCRFSKSSD